MSELEAKLIKIADPVLDDMGFRLVLLEFDGKILQIMAENKETGTITLDECASLSRALSPVLEVADLIDGAYRLEISSPGIDRPLITAEDYDRFNGLEAKIELKQPIEGSQKRYRGRIKEQNNNNILLETDDGIAELPIENIRKAKLVMNDELMEATKIKANDNQAETAIL